MFILWYSVASPSPTYGTAYFAMRNITAKSKSNRQQGICVYIMYIYICDATSIYMYMHMLYMYEYQSLVVVLI